MIMALDSSGIMTTSDTIKTKLLQKVKIKTTRNHKQESAFYSKNAKEKKKKK